MLGGVGERFCSRVFLNLGFAKPRFCNSALFTKTTGHENDENDEDNSDSQAARGLIAGFAEITENTEMTKTTRIQGAKHIGSPKPRFRKTRCKARK